MLSYFGREDENTVIPVGRSRDVPPDRILSDKYCIELFRRLMLKYHRAVTWDYRFYDDENNLDFDEKYDPEAILATNPHSKAIYLVQLGVYHPLFGRLHKEMADWYFEVSTPAHTTPRDIANAVRRGQQLAGFLAREASTDDCEVRIYNSVSDRKGLEAETCGGHRNFLGSRELFYEMFRGQADFSGAELSQYRLAQDFTTYLVLHTIFIGEGKIGVDRETMPVNYQISARADFINALINFSTTAPKPIVNTRDEPHANAKKFARFHVINGEGNRSRTAMELDFGLIALVLDAFANGFRIPWRFANPVAALHEISRDIFFQKSVVIVENGERKSKRAIVLLLRILNALKKHVARTHVADWCPEILGKAVYLAKSLRRQGPLGEASRYLDWCIKFKFLLNSMKRLNLSPDLDASWVHKKIHFRDNAYHRLDNDQILIAASRFCDAEGFDEFYEPFGNPGEPRFWSEGEPTEGRAHLYWLLTTDPHLRERTRIRDWGEVDITEDHTATIKLGDPQRFGKAELALLLRGKTDFARKENRLHLIKVLEENGEISYEGTARPFVEETEAIPFPFTRIGETIDESDQHCSLRLFRGNLPGSSER